jgi:hypothetical protein
LAAVSISPKKNTHTTNIVMSAHATSGSSRRLRNLFATTVTYPARISPHNRIEPSSADHIVAMLNSAGVVDEPCSATYASE